MIRCFQKNEMTNSSEYYSLPNISKTETRYTILEINKNHYDYP